MYAGRAETADGIAGWNETRTIPRDEVPRERGREEGRKRPFDVLNGGDNGTAQRGGSNSFSLNWALKALKESSRVVDVAVVCSCQMNLGN